MGSQISLTAHTLYSPSGVGFVLGLLKGGGVESAGFNPSGVSFITYLETKSIQLFITFQPLWGVICAHIILMNIH